MRFGYGVCVGSWEKFHRFALPGIPEGAPVVALSGQTSIFAAYNGILDLLARSCDAAVLIHDDLEIRDPHAERKLAEALADPAVAVAGVAGAAHVESLAWWTGDRVGHTRMDIGALDFGVRAGRVDAVDGILLALSPWALADLRFDERTYTGFHGYDVDVCFQARAAGKRVVVADVDTWHHSMGGFGSPKMYAEWVAAGETFQRKWQAASV